jgi:hypothetical protein
VEAVSGASPDRPFAIHEHGLDESIPALGVGMRLDTTVTEESDALLRCSDPRAAAGRFGHAAVRALETGRAGTADIDRLRSRAEAPRPVRGDREDTAVAGARQAPHRLQRHGFRAAASHADDLTRIRDPQPAFGIEHG